MSRLDHLVPPPLVALIVGLLMGGAAHFLEPLDLPENLRTGFALLLGSAGVAVAAAGVLTFRRLGASIDPHHVDRGEVLATVGVYRWTRNPMYLGMALVLCGYAVWLARPVDALGPMLFVAYITRFQILGEERAMRSEIRRELTRPMSARLAAGCDRSSQAPRRRFCDKKIFALGDCGDKSRRARQG